MRSEFKEKLEQGPMSWTPYTRDEIWWTAGPRAEGGEVHEAQVLKGGAEFVIATHRRTSFFWIQLLHPLAPGSSPSGIPPEGPTGEDSRAGNWRRGPSYRQLPTTSFPPFPSPQFLFPVFTFHSSSPGAITVT